MKDIIINFLLGYLFIMSLIGFSIMGIDKGKARRKMWRIPEKTLFFIAFAGGGIGSFLGMYAFRHKTKHTKFVILLPVAAIIYTIIIILITR